jgi:hypothetical protein
MLGITLAPASSSAWFGSGEPPWDAPVMPGGKIVKTEGAAIFIEYDQKFEQVLAWYKESLKSYKDEVYRDWKDQVYIEDQGGAKWHSIGINKDGGDKTTVKITRDNYTWVFSTLLIRFAGVFIVLCILWILLNINSAVMKKLFPEQKKTGAK